MVALRAMAPPKSLSLLWACACLAACSNEKSDEFSVSLDSGSQLGEGDAGGEPDGDGGPAHTLDAGADESQEPDASEPSRTDLTVTARSATLARCAEMIVDLAWQGEPSLPAVTVSGLPEGVSYEVSPKGNGKAEVKLTADQRVALGEKHTRSVPRPSSRSLRRSA